MTSVGNPNDVLHVLADRLHYLAQTLCANTEGLTGSQAKGSATFSGIRQRRSRT